MSCIQSTSYIKPTVHGTVLVVGCYPAERQNINILEVRCLLDAPPEGVEKLHTIKTARFCGRVLFGCESYRFTSEKLKCLFFCFMKTKTTNIINNLSITSKK